MYEIHFILKILLQRTFRKCSSVPWITQMHDCTFLSNEGFQQSCRVDMFSHTAHVNRWCLTEVNCGRLSHFQWEIKKNKKLLLLCDYSRLNYFRDIGSAADVSMTETVLVLKGAGNFTQQLTKKKTNGKCSTKLIQRPHEWQRLYFYLC